MEPNDTEQPNGNEPMSYETVASIIGIFFIIYSLNMKGPNKYLKP